VTRSSRGAGRQGGAPRRRGGVATALESRPVPLPAASCRRSPGRRAGNRSMARRDAR
jgi:hypothetical protein